MTEPFALRRAVDVLRLSYDTALAAADDKEVALRRLRAWVNGGAQEAPHGHTPQSMLDTAESEQTNRRAELEQLRTQLTDASAALAAALDAGTPLFGAHSTEPITLLPVRIETKFADPRTLNVRVYPDDIHIRSFDERLSAEELAAGQGFWAKPDEAAWVALTSRFSPARASWIARATSAGEPAPASRDGGLRRTPDVSTMPSRWRFLGLVDGAVVVDRTGSDLPDPLPLGLLAADEEAPDREHAAWLADFPAAVAAGMGITLTLPPEVDHLDELFVIGVKDTPPDQAADLLKQTLRGHAYTAGLGFLRPGTATNNTPQSRSAWSSRPVLSPPAPATGEPAEHTDARRLSGALGLDKAGFLADCAEANGDTEGAIAAMTMLSWPGLADNLVNDATYHYSVAGEEYVQSDAAPWLKIRDHLAAYVRSRGPLPTIRVGNQPYGLLPVSTVDEWRPAMEDGADALILPWLLRLRHHWRAAIAPGWIPRVTDGVPVDRVAVDVLSRLPVAIDLVVRRVLSPQGGLEKFDKLAQRSPGPVMSVGGVDFGSGLRWATPTELTSNLAWTSGSGKPDFTLVAERLAPGAENYAGMFARSRAQLTDAVALLNGTLSPEDYDQRWPQPREGQEQPPAPRAPTVFQNPDGDLDFIPSLLHLENWDSYPGEEGADLLHLALRITPSVDQYVMQKLGPPGPPEEELQGLLSYVRPGLPEVPRVLAALHALAELSAADWVPLLLELFDVFSHRWDAWATSLATMRLTEARAAGAAGNRIGGYGWVENLRPGPPREHQEESTLSIAPSDGYVHAPSLQHATTAAVLRSGFLAHEGDQTFAVNLTSRRARIARWLLGGVRRGQNLGSLLGYRFERALHDAGLDQFKAPYRHAYPAPVSPEPSDGAEQPELWARSSEAIAARNVVDGMALARAAAAGSAPVFDEQLRPMLTDLAESLDAVGDLLLAESVHQLVGGNPVRAGLTADTLGRGEDVPDRFDVLRTPHRGRAVTHRIAAVLPAQPTRPAGWAADPLAALEPRVDAWVADLLGPAAGWPLAGVLRAQDGTETAFTLSADQLGFSAIGFAVDAAGERHPRLDRRVAELTGVPQNPGTVEYRAGWAELSAVLGRIRTLLGDAQPMLPEHVLGQQVTQQSGTMTADLGELRDRVSAFTATVGTAGQRAALGIEESPAALAGLAKLTALPGDPATPGWLATAATAVAELLGTDLPLIPLLTGGSLPAAPAGVSGSAVADWLRRFARIRPTTRVWHETLLLAGARAGRPCPLTVTQTPAGGGWIGAEFEPLNRPPARSHLACHLPLPLPEAGPVAGLLFDEWAEVLPGSDALSATKTGEKPVPVESELTGLAFHFDRPDAKAPQAILVAVPPDLERGWTTDGLAMVVRDTLELAKLRAADLGDLPLIDDLLPAMRTLPLNHLSAILRDFWTNLAE